jgi:transcriptional regulator with XRE-family HTH domain
MTLGEYIKRRRQFLGMTQADVAEAIGSTHSYLSLLENNKREPSLTVLYRLAETLKFRVNFGPANPYEEVKDE